MITRSSPVHSRGNDGDRASPIAASPPPSVKSVKRNSSVDTPGCRTPDSKGYSDNRTSEYNCTANMDTIYRYIYENSDENYSQSNDAERMEVNPAGDDATNDCLSARTTQELNSDNNYSMNTSNKIFGNGNEDTVISSGEMNINNGDNNITENVNTTTTTDGRSTPAAVCGTDGNGIQTSTLRGAKVVRVNQEETSTCPKYVGLQNLLGPNYDEVPCSTKSSPAGEVAEVVKPIKLPLPASSSFCSATSASLSSSPSLLLSASPDLLSLSSPASSSSSSSSSSSAQLSSASSSSTAAASISSPARSPVRLASVVVEQEVPLTSAEQNFKASPSIHVPSSTSPDPSSQTSSLSSSSSSLASSSSVSSVSGSSSFHLSRGFNDKNVIALSRQLLQTQQNLLALQSSFQGLKEHYVTRCSSLESRIEQEVDSRVACERAAIFAQDKNYFLLQQMKAINTKYLQDIYQFRQNIKLFEKNQLTAMQKKKLQNIQIKHLKSIINKQKNIIMDLRKKLGNINIDDHVSSGNHSCVRNDICATNDAENCHLTPTPTNTEKGDNNSNTIPSNDEDKNECGDKDKNNDNGNNSNGSKNEDQKECEDKNLDTKDDAVNEFASDNNLIAENNNCGDEDEKSANENGYGDENNENEKKDDDEFDSSQKLKDLHDRKNKDETKNDSESSNILEMRENQLERLAAELDNLHMLCISQGDEIQKLLSEYEKEKKKTDDLQKELSKERKKREELQNQIKQAEKVSHYRAGLTTSSVPVSLHLPQKSQTSFATRSRIPPIEFLATLKADVDEILEITKNNANIAKRNAEQCLNKKHHLSDNPLLENLQLLSEIKSGDEDSRKSKGDEPTGSLKKSTKRPPQNHVDAEAGEESSGDDSDLNNKSSSPKDDGNSKMVNHLYNDYNRNENNNGNNYAKTDNSNNCDNSGDGSEDSIHSELVSSDENSELSEIYESEKGRNKNTRKKKNENDSGDSGNESRPNVPSFVNHARDSVMKVFGRFD